MDAIDRFTTERLIAERLLEDHLDDLLRMDKDPRIMNTIGGVRTEEETHAYLQRNLDHWEEHRHGLWMLRLRADNSFVGRAAVRRLHLGGDVENVIGYALMPAYWGRGLATEIVGAMVDLAFSRLGLDDLVAGALPDNRASRRVMEKNGMRYWRDAFYKNAPHVLYRIGRW